MTTESIDPQLRRNSLGLPELIFQSVTHIAPATNMVFTFPIIALKAGPDMPLSFLLATIVCFFIGNTVAQFSSYMPSSGGYYTLDRGGGFETPADKPFARTHAGGFRGLYDLGAPEKSRFMIATGESGHIFSRHYRDLAPLWIDGKSITLAGSENDLQKAGAAELILSP